VSVRVAALYDVHGNLPALRAVLGDPRLGGADAVVVGGDLVAGPCPSECLALLEGLDLPVWFVRGNGDREVARPSAAGGHAGETARFARERLRPDELDRVAAWPLAVTIEVAGLGPTLFCHAVPGADTPIVTRATPDEDVRTAFARAGAAVVVCGHTHQQFDRLVGGGLRVVNAGSVGMPYEGSADPRWALLGPDVELVATPYDAVAALAEMETLGFPALDDWLGAIVRQEVAPDEVTAIFERRRLEEASL
jgi:predicted phosphodiesterase